VSRLRRRAAVVPLSCIHHAVNRDLSLALYILQYNISVPYVLLSGVFLYDMKTKTGSFVVSGRASASKSL